MTGFDKKIWELSRKIEIPKGYDQAVDDVLKSLEEKEEISVANRYSINKKKIGFAICLVCVFCFLKINSIEANANIFETFKLTILDIFNLGRNEENETMGVESNELQVKSKADLMIELQQTVIDSHGIYLLVKITAPSNIEFDSDITFDYFSFCEGDNYNADNLIAGARDCYLLETMKEKPNVATYVVNLTSDMEKLEGKNVTAYFKDLTSEPDGENPELLVEGMWSITFQADLTVREQIKIDGNQDMTFPFMDTTASLEYIEMTPLGLTLLMDVSKVPFEELGISDTEIVIKLKMIDGSEIQIMPYNPKLEGIVDSGNVEYIEKDGKSYQKNTYSFAEILDLTRVAGVYIQDLYVPVE